MASRNACSAGAGHLWTAKWVGIGQVIPKNALSPIFVRGMSRSGGTLMVTVLDAHPDVAMSYELYPTLLEPSESDPELDLPDLATRIGRAAHDRNALKIPRSRGLRTFLGRVRRGGIGYRRFAELLHAHLDHGMDFVALEGRMRFIESCCREKMRLAGKKRWGLKCNNRYEDYLQFWPDAYFLNMVRDGRDVLASQMNTGSFDSAPMKVAKAWVQTHRHFQDFAEKPGVRAYAVRYEELVKSPEDVLRRIMAFLNLAYDPRILEFHKLDLTIFKSSHLSLEQISQPMNASQVGRWRNDLNSEQVALFEQTAGALMVELGYEVQSNAD